MTGSMTSAERATDALLRATSSGDWPAALALMAPGATVWQNSVGVTTPFADALSGMQKMAERVGPWEYVHVRRVASATACCEQHLVRFLHPERDVIEIEVCVVVNVNDEGLITTLEEYLDQQTFDRARGRQPSRSSHDSRRESGG